MARKARKVPIHDATPRKIGRPTLYRPEVCESARLMAHGGATEPEICLALGINRETLHRWKCQHSEFRAALQLGRDTADERVETALYMRANGYTRTAYKVLQHDGAPVVVAYLEHIPPDVAAAFIWLKNRRPDVWRDRHEHLSVRVNAVRAMTTAEIQSELARLECLPSSQLTTTEDKPLKGQDMPALARLSADLPSSLPREPDSEP